MGRLVSQITYDVLSGKLNYTQALTHNETTTLGPGQVTIIAKALISIHINPFQEPTWLNCQ